MTRARAIPSRLARLASRAGRLLLRPLLVAVALRASVTVLGQRPTAAIVALVLLAWGLRSWVRLERRLDANRRRALDPDAYIARYMATSPTPTATRAVQHVAFARALVAVSARYLAHCEDQADDDATSREGWR